MFSKSIDIERQLNIMKLHALTAEEWLLAELFMMALDEPKRSSYLGVYLNECKKDRLSIEILESLKEKKVFSSSTKIPQKGEEFRLENFELSGTYLNNYFKCSYEGGEELKDLYPSTTTINGKIVSLTNITKGGYQHEEDFFAKYNKQIRYSRKTHQEVMELLQWSIDKGLLHYGIVEYVTTKKWQEHAKMRESGEIAGYVLKVDTLEDS